MRKYPTGRMTAILALAAFLTGMNGTSAWANPEEAAVQETQPAKPAPTEFAHILSCGIEDKEDLLADVAQALEAASQS